MKKFATTIFLLIFVFGAFTEALSSSVGSKFLIANTASEEMALSASFDGTNYMVAIGTEQPSNETVYMSADAQRIDLNGSLVGPLISSGCYDGTPFVSFGGANYLHVGGDCNTWNHEIWGRLIDPTGTVGANVIITTTGAEKTGVAYGGGKHLFVYTRSISGTDESKVYGTLVDSTGIVVVSDIPISSGSGANGVLNVAFDGSRFLVVWTDDTNKYEVKGRFVSISGTLGTEFTVNASPELSHNPLSVGFGGTNYLVVWSDKMGGINEDLYGQMVDTSGNLVGGVIPITTGAGGQFLPGIAFDGINYLVTWSDHRNDTNNDNICDSDEGSCSDIYGQYVNQAGELMGTEFIIINDSGNQVGIVVGFNGGKFLVLINDGVLLNEPESWGDVYGVFVTPPNGNTPPVANAGPDQNVETGALVTVDGSGCSDADGDPLSYNWSFSTMPTGSTAALSDSTAVNPGFTADLAGTYALNLIVNDGTEDSAADEVIITADEASPPDGEVPGNPFEYLQLQVDQLATDLNNIELIPGPEGPPGPMGPPGPPGVCTCPITIEMWNSLVAEVEELKSSLVVTFQKTFGGVGDELGREVQQTSDGGYVLTGHTSTYGAGGLDMYLIKLDSSGNLVWDKAYGGAADENGESVQQTSDGGYIIVGSTYSFGAGSNDVYLVKTDPLGNVIWEKTFGGVSADRGLAIQQTADGGYIISGNTLSFGLGSFDVYLIKTDSAGNVIWERTFGGTNFDIGVSVQQTPDGGYVVGGFTRSFGVGLNDLYMIRTDAFGTALWEKTFGGVGSEASGYTNTTSDGGYIITGRTDSFGAGSSDVYLVKTDPDGNVSWEKTFGGVASEYSYAVQQTVDGGYIITGRTNSFGAGGYDLYLIKTDVNGNSIWEQTFGGANDEFSWSVLQATDGGFVTIGHTNSFGAGLNDFYLIKTDANGNVN